MPEEPPYKRSFYDTVVRLGTYWGLLTVVDEPLPKETLDTRDTDHDFMQQDPAERLDERVDKETRSRIENS